MITTSSSRRKRHECPLHPRRKPSVSEKADNDGAQVEKDMVSKSIPADGSSDINVVTTTMATAVETVAAEAVPLTTAADEIPTEHLVDVASTESIHKVDVDPLLPINIATNEDRGVDEEADWQARWSLKNLLNPERDLTGIGRMTMGSITNMQSSEMKLLSYEVERSKRVIDILKKQLSERDESIGKMLIHVNMLEEWKDKLDSGQQALANEHESEIESKIGVLNEKYMCKHQECQTLKSKLLAMEQDHMLKDGELRNLQLKYNELKLNENKLALQVDALKADREIVANSIQRLKASYKERQVNMQLALDREYQEQAMRLIEQIEIEKKKVIEKEKEVRDRNVVLRRAELECSKLVAVTLQLKKVMQAKDEEIKHMTYALLDLEENVVKNDQNASSRIYATKALLDGVRKEKMELKSSNRILMKELASIRGKTASTELGDLLDKSVGSNSTDFTKHRLLLLQPNIRK